VLSGGPSAPTGRTRLAAVIGDPVAHSLSPVIHNAAFAASGLDWVFVALPVPAGFGPEAVSAMRTLGLGGLSVTMPLKAEVLDGVDRVSDTAAALGAANCLAWSGPELVAHNTDGAGFVDSLRADAGLDPTGAVVVVLGGGGAARALVHALGQVGVAEVVVVNRSRARAEATVALAPAVARVGGPDDLLGSDIVVNATSIGMGRAPDDPDALPVPAGSLAAGQTVIDLVYEPARTALLTAAASAGARPVDGVGMLVGQAAHAYTLWTGQSAPRSVMSRAARAAIERR
jgi:shikimate dehydrogenase